MTRVKVGRPWYLLQVQTEERCTQRRIPSSNPGTFANRIGSLVHFLEASISSSEEMPTSGERLASLPWAPVPPSCGAVPGGGNSPASPGHTWGHSE